MQDSMLRAEAKYLKDEDGETSKDGESSKDRDKD